MKIYGPIIFCILYVNFFIPITAQSRSKKVSNDKQFFDILGFCQNDKSDRCVRGILEDAIKRFAKGVPELNMKPMDPLVLDNLNLNLDSGVKIYFKKGDVRGIRNCHVKKAKMVKNKVKLEVICSVVIDGDYVAKGKIKGFNIDGDGHITITIRDLKLSITATFGTEKKKSKTYLTLDNLKTSYEYLGVITYDATNLVKGMPFMDKAIIKALNKNWKAIAKQFGDPGLQYALKYITAAIKDFLCEVPANQLKKYIS